MAASVLLLAFTAFILCIVNGATVTYDFKIGWVIANPDGAFDRPTIGINGQWPIPQITANVGDRVIVNVVNQLGNQSTSLHFHGLYMNGSTHMDGPVGVSQCSIPPDAMFTYDFMVRSFLSVFCEYFTNIDRLTNRAHTGITPTTMDSIQMVFEAL